MQSPLCVGYKNNCTHPLKDHEFYLCRKKIKSWGPHPTPHYLFSSNSYRLFHSPFQPTLLHPQWPPHHQHFHILGTLILRIPRWLRQCSVVWSMPTYSEGFQPTSVSTNDSWLPPTHPDSPFFSPRPASPSLQHLFVITNASYNYHRKMENSIWVPPWQFSSAQWTFWVLPQNLSTLLKWSFDYYRKI